MSARTWEIAVRLVLAAALGSFIGFERERLLWRREFARNMVVCVGACLVMVVSAYGSKACSTST